MASSSVGEELLDFSTFYAKQLELINVIEDVLVPKTEEERNQTLIFQQRDQRAVRLLTILNLLVNIVRCSTV